MHPESGGLGEPRRVLVVEARGAWYALDSTAAREVVRLPPVTRLAGAPAWVLGLMNLRGALMPVMDLGARFDDVKGAAVAGAERSVVVLSLGGRVLGAAVDEVHEVHQSSFQAPSAPVHDGLIAGMGHFGDRIVLLVDVAELLRQVLV